MPTLFGFAVILLFLILAVQVAFDLYARSTVSSVAVDAARMVADDHVAVATAEQRARAELGAYSDATGFTWTVSPALVVLTVHFQLRRTHYELAPLPGLNTFTRTVRVRVERIVCPPGRRCVSVGG